MREQLVRMSRIQELALEVQRARATIEQAPVRLEEIEARFRERNAEYVALRARSEELERDQRERNFELRSLEQARDKLMQDLMQVRNQREYSAVLKELDIVKAKISEHEDAILRHMEELEALRPQLATFTSRIEAERRWVEQERAKVEIEVERARQTVARCLAERERLEGELPAPLVESIRRVEELRQGVFLARVEDGMCQACYVRVRPQVFQEIRLARELHTCSQCRRFLYYEPALRAAPSAGESGGEGHGPGLEAHDRGAV